MGGEKEALRPLHVPVLLRETLEAFAPLFAPDGTGSARLLDGTLGLGGHTGALLGAHPELHVLGLDRDAAALAHAQQRLAPYKDRFTAAHCRFSRFAEALDRIGWDRVDAALVDIGVSSMQLDTGERGFSVHADGPLDMRMDPSSGVPPARELVNTWDFRRLRDCIATLGEDPQAGRVARAICQERQRVPITSTLQLASIVWNAYPPAWRAKARHHPATRTFQALRMTVNNELGELGAFLDGILSRLRVGGRLVVITFHSLEDRLVKQAMRRWSQGCLCPPHILVCRCGHVPQVRVLTRKPRTAGPDELAANSRASSAKLRCCEKIDDWAAPPGGDG